MRDIETIHKTLGPGLQKSGAECFMNFNSMTHPITLLDQSLNSLPFIIFMSFMVIKTSYKQCAASAPKKAQGERRKNQTPIRLLSSFALRPFQ